MGRSETWITLVCPECKRHVQIELARTVLPIWRCPYCEAILTRKNEERS